MSALVELEQRRGLVGARSARVAELENASQEAARRVANAKEALADFYRQRERHGDVAQELTDVNLADLPLGQDLSLGRDASGIVIEGDISLGAEPSDFAEAQLIAELRAAEGGVTFEADVLPSGGQVDVRLRAVDPRAQAMLQGAREALEDAEGELASFAAIHLGDLLAERVERVRQLGERAARVVREGQSVGAELEAERSWQVGLYNLAGRPELIESLPDNPMRGIGEMSREVVLLLPEQIA